jgi:hypothetical protein
MEFKYGNEPQEYERYGTDGPINDTSDLGATSKPDIERPIVHPGEIGQSVTEGSRFGNFLQTVTGAIRTGASKIELQTQMGGGGEPVGAEAYGAEARQALREIAKVNEVELTSVHVPTQVGNVSGFNPQQGFVDEQRKQAVDEIKKAIDFAADVTGGGSIVYHTGEFQRPISEQGWAVEKDANGNKVRDSEGNLKYDFLGYQEEPGKAVTYMVDDRNGKIIGDVRKSNVIREPEYLRAEEDYQGQDVDGNPVKIQKGDLVTEDRKYIDLANPNHLFHRVAVWNDELKRFKTRKLAWDEIEERKEEWNRKHPENKKTTEEMAYRIQVENQILQYRGSSLYHGRFYQDEKRERDAIKKSLAYYTELERQLPPDKVWMIMKQDPNSRRYAGADLTGYESKLPSEILKEALIQAEQSLQYTHEASASADAQADLLTDTLEHVEPVSNFAKEQSWRSMAESGIYAMDKTREKNLKKDIYLSPENIFPEMGYGSHPEELIELVKGAREKMIEFLTEKKIKDPHNRIKLVKDKNGEIKEEIREVENPWYRGISKEAARQLADKHIKANLDTQHLGMWAKHFQPKYLAEKGRLETPEEKNKRFDGWYKKQIERLAEENILGEIHIVDGYHTGGHSHLPAGQGDLPVVDAVEYLKKKGFKGVMISEAHGEEQMGAGRILTKAWEAFGAQVFPRGGYFGGSAGGGGGFGAPVRFTDIYNSYFQKKQGPYFVFGGYSPSNDWTMWSEVPLE